jgi:general stress protein CsbA
VRKCFATQQQLREGDVQHYAENATDFIARSIRVSEIKRGIFSRRVMLSLYQSTNATSGEVLLSQMLHPLAFNAFPVRTYVRWLSAILKVALIFAAGEKPDNYNKWIVDTEIQNSCKSF